MDHHYVPGQHPKKWREARSAALNSAEQNLALDLTKDERFNWDVGMYYIDGIYNTIFALPPQETIVGTAMQTIRVRGHELDNRFRRHQETPPRDFSPVPFTLTDT